MWGIFSQVPSDFDELGEKDDKQHVEVVWLDVKEAFD